VIGDTPQPGKTPRSEGDPWSFGDPDAAWWRGETDRPARDAARHPAQGPGQQQAATGGTGTLIPPEAPRRTGEAAEAHAAGSRDASEELTAPVTAVERDHDQPDPHRYDPLKPPAGHTAKIAPETVAADEPDVMILPEPSPRNRPTVSLGRDQVPVPLDRDQVAPPPDRDQIPVPLDRDQVAPPPDRDQAPSPPDRSPVPVPEQGWHRSTVPLPPLTGTADVDARLEKLENSPFWQDRPVEPRVAGQPAHAAVRTHRGRRPAARMRLSAHVSLVTLALIAAFFGWVSAEPFWLAAGHGDQGVATVTSCVGGGVTQRCAGQFATRDGRFTVTRVTLLGVPPGQREPGATAPARMVSLDSHQAYLGNTGTLLHLRWILGFALVLICGYAVAGVTGARRLETGRARRTAVLLSLAGPLALLAGFLIAAY
jgi:hypothetical protein